MSKRFQKIFLNIMMILAGVIISLILLELGVRVWLSKQQQVEASEFICSTQLGWRGKPFYQGKVTTDDYPHSVSHNSVGMHDGEHPVEKSANTFRIMMLGDSFIRAGHVNEAETAHQQLENLLNQSSATNFEVISAGMTGWGTGQELIYYTEEGRFYQPDLVLLMLYIGNDFLDNLPGRALTVNAQNCYTPYFTLCGNQFDPVPWPHVPGLKPAMGECPFGQKTVANTLDFLYRHSKLYTQLESLLTSEERVDQLPYYPLYIPEKHQLFDYSWQLTIELVKELRRQVEQNNTQFRVVVIAPGDVIKLSVLPEDIREVLYLERIPDLRNAELDRPNKRLAARFAQENIIFLDLQPLFIQHIAQTENELYFSIDKHWNVAGNAFAAQTIYEWLITSDGIPN